MIYECAAQTDKEQQTVDGFLKWNSNNILRGLSDSIYICTSYSDKKARRLHQQWKYPISWQVEVYGTVLWI